MTADGTLHTRANGRRRSPERNYGDGAVYSKGALDLAILVRILRTAALSGYLGPCVERRDSDGTLNSTQV